MLRNVVKALRNKLRKWLGVVDAAPDPTTIEREAKRKGMSIAGALLAAAGEKFVARAFGPPTLPPGVVPVDYAYSASDDPGALGPYVALDSELVTPTYGYANQFNSGLGFPGYAYLAELSQRSEYRAPSETIASEMTREWIKLVVQGKSKKKDAEKDAALEAEEVAADEDIPADLQSKLEELEEDLKKFNVRDMFRKLAELDGLFGRSQLYIEIDRGGREKSEVDQLPLPIEPETIPKDSLKGFKVIEPMWTTPFTYNATDPTTPDFYVPKAWFVLGRRIHKDRLLTFVMREVPDMLKPSYNFGGLSMTQLMEPNVYQWLRTRNSISDLVHNFSVMVLATDMTAALGGDAVAGTSLLDRIKLFIANRDNQGLTVVNKDTEELTSVNVPLAGLHDLQAQAQRNLSAPSHIPLIKLIGEAAAGLNASDEGAIKVFYDFVRACQMFFFGPHLKTVLQILQLNRYGKIDDAIGFEFVPLSAPTVKELAEIRKADAETDAVYIDKGVISPEESRNRVASDPQSGYNNLSGPPPEPPSLGEMGAEHEFGEEAAQAAHERGEESAEAAHKRQLEAEKQSSAKKD